MSVILPEIVLYNSLKSILKVVKDDFHNNQLEDTIIYACFAKDENGNNIQIENFNYLEQAIAIFANRDREMEISLGYNMQVSGQASIHILLPSEQGKSLLIGASENYQPNVARDNGNQIAEQFSNSYDATYQLMITSENSAEAILIYHFLKAVMLSLYYHFELSGLRDPKWSGQDVSIQQDLIPTHIFHRALGITFWYEVTIPNMITKKLISGLQITGIINTNNTNVGTSNTTTSGLNNNNTNIRTEIEPGAYPTN